MVSDHFMRLRLSSGRTYQSENVWADYCPDCTVSSDEWKRRAFSEARKCSPRENVDAGLDFHDLVIFAHIMGLCLMRT